MDKIANRRQVPMMLGEVLEKYCLIRDHRDQLLAILRRRKRIAREQERTIQRLAAERKELRERVEHYESSPFGTYIVPPMYGGAGPWIKHRDVVTFNSDVASFEGIVEDMTYHNSAGWRARVYIGDGITCNVPTCKLTLKNDANATVSARLAKEANMLMGRGVLPGVDA